MRNVKVLTTPLNPALHMSAAVGLLDQSSVSDSLITKTNKQMPICRYMCTLILIIYVYFEAEVVGSS